MPGQVGWVVVGVDNGGTANNGTVMDADGQFLIDRMAEIPSYVREGPDKAVQSLLDSVDHVLGLVGLPRSAVRAVGLDTPGPASATGVLSSRGATNFASPEWWGFDIRGAMEDRLGLPVVYNNDGNAAALYAHALHFGLHGRSRSSVSAIVGTGLGGGIVHQGRVIKGATGAAGELGHVHIPMAGLLEPDQPVPRCNCGFSGDAEGVASLTGIELNLLPYWLSRYPDHELGSLPLSEAARSVRAYGEAGDPMATRIFEQQAVALGRLFTIAANFLDPDAYFIGGGVVETGNAFKTWFLQKVRDNTTLREEAAAAAEFVLVPELDMAGARGAAMAALDAVLEA